MHCHTEPPPKKNIIHQYWWFETWNSLILYNFTSTHLPHPSIRPGGSSERGQPGQRGSGLLARQPRSTERRVTWCFSFMAIQPTPPRTTYPPKRNKGLIRPGLGGGWLTSHNSWCFIKRPWPWFFVWEGGWWSFSVGEMEFFGQIFCLGGDGFFEDFFWWMELFKWFVDYCFGMFLVRLVECICWEKLKLQVVGVVSEKSSDV